MAVQKPDIVGNRKYLINYFTNLLIVARRQNKFSQGLNILISLNIFNL